MAFPPLFRWGAYGVNLWDSNAIGMFFAMLLGGAALSAFSFAPGTWVQQLFTKTGAAGAGIGGAFGMPLFMCSACSAPVSLGFWRGGAALETTLGVILGSALFQPVALAAIVLLMPPPMAIARILFGLALLLGVVPLIARFTQPAAACRLPDADEPAPKLLSLEELGSSPPTGWAQAFGHAVRAWWRHTLDFAFRFAPPMALAGFAVGVVLTIAPPQMLTNLAQTGPLLIIVMALIGTVIQVPSMFEIPLVLAILALGFGAGAGDCAPAHRAFDRTHHGCPASARVSRTGISGHIRPQIPV
ncbi:MAG: permease, partial [Egibacteraceae bacterium]